MPYCECAIALPAWVEPGRSRGRCFAGSGALGARTLRGVVSTDEASPLRVRLSNGCPRSSDSTGARVCRQLLGVVPVRRRTCPRDRPRAPSWPASRPRRIAHPFNTTGRCGTHHGGRPGLADHPGKAPPRRRPDIRARRRRSAACIGGRGGREPGTGRATGRPDIQSHCDSARTEARSNGPRPGRLSTHAGGMDEVRSREAVPAARRLGSSRQWSAAPAATGRPGAGSAAVGELSEVPPPGRPRPPRAAPAPVARWSRGSRPGPPRQPRAAGRRAPVAGPPAVPEVPPQPPRAAPMPAARLPSSRRSRPADPGRPRPPGAGRAAVTGVPPSRSRPPRAAPAAGSYLVSSRP